MAGGSRRVWRAAPATLAVVWVFVALSAIGIPALAAIEWLRSGNWPVPAFLLVLAVAAVCYGWRFGLYPRLIATSAGLEVANPMGRSFLSWDQLTVIAPGPDGLVLASEGFQTAAWCIQQPKSAARRGRSTRADQIVAELERLQESYDPPLTDAQTGIEIRRPRQSEVGLLADLEAAAAKPMDAQTVKPGDEQKFDPESARTETEAADLDRPASEAQSLRVRRWRRLLRDRKVQIRLLEVTGVPVGQVAWDGRGELIWLSVATANRHRGAGSLLLQFVTEELNASAAAELFAWVDDADLTTRGFLRARGWRDTDQRALPDGTPIEPDQTHTDQPSGSPDPVEPSSEQDDGTKPEPEAKEVVIKMVRSNPTSRRAA